jgi:Ca2+-binding EF-hand superfamily protein
MRHFLIAAAVMLVPSVAMADWASSFQTLDTDGNGRISRTEYEANVAKLKLDPAPTFTAMDADVNNAIDDDEWAAAEKMAKAFPVSCKSSSESWCPKGY